MAEDYVHRIGRTGRAGAKGKAISLVCADEAKQLAGIERLIKGVITREMVDGFEPDHRVPSSNSKTQHGEKFVNKPGGNKPTSGRRPRKTGSNSQGQTKSTNSGQRRNTSGNR